MGDNFEAWFSFEPEDDNPVFRAFAKFILQAWNVCEKACEKAEGPLSPPKIIPIIIKALEEMSHKPGIADTLQTEDTMGEFHTDFSVPSTTCFQEQSLPYSMEVQDTYARMNFGMYGNVPGQAPFGASLDPLGWPASGVWPTWGIQ
jgi:hypothetical protein